MDRSVKAIVAYYEGFFTWHEFPSTYNTQDKKKFMEGVEFCNEAYCRHAEIFFWPEHEKEILEFFDMHEPNHMLMMEQLKCMN